MNPKVPKESTDLAGRIFQAKDYNRNDALASGFALTHEQASDVYNEGEIGSKAEEEGKKS